MWIYGLLISAVGLEALVGWRFRRRLYEWRDTELSAGLAAGWLLISALDTLVAGAAITFAYHYRVLNLGALRAAPLLAFLAVDLLYYLWHLASHYPAWLWASHFPHHTAKRLNMLASIRQGWTDTISGAWLTSIAMGLLGFTLVQEAPYFTLLFVTQLFAHNEWTPRLGPLEWVFVTPSNHRVHHSLETQHINRNFGGVLIIWDRLFGTYVPEGPQVLHDFGLAGFDADASSPLGVAFHVWRRMLSGRRGLPASQQEPAA
jgi:sterol desaturase/sphingolipid hydroxylase (fatty acid hydroxylase superfamily)